MKVATIVGARPQFIKSGPVSRVLRSRGITELVIHTGQHYDRDMSEVFFKELHLSKPDFALEIGSGPHGLQTGRMLEAVESVLMKTEPDWVLVYGDTNSTLAGALAASKLSIPVAHVEAGLRANQRHMAEEINRIVVDHISDILFAPTRAAVDNLRKEGVPDDWVHLTGDVMYDAALYYGELCASTSRVLDDLRLVPRNYVLVTVHRAENTDDRYRLEAIAAAIKGLSKSWPVVFPLHPRTRLALDKALITMDSPDLLVVPPVGYLDMVMLEKNARLVLTDSGGVQKEASFYGVPCTVLRETTEWVELLEFGFANVVSDMTTRSIMKAVEHMLRTNIDSTLCPYGDGRASERIVESLIGLKERGRQ